ncbi:hypothetical protein FIM10_02165 [Sphingomonadales bacterium 56]|uniref:hypothetical protein n=1 Tax=Sphingobium sp. S6 TaxID=2758386 RepID=UPI00191B81F4|nr:hypothetical protein [Sphingobium sp. S6]MBY2927486.1 hypothetical protein [Sphingomonadales bacterium 56]
MSRPDGSGQINGSVWLFIAAVVFFVLGFLVPNHPYGSVAGSDRFILLALSACAVSVGFPLLLVGLIIRAISFLPGKEDAVRTTDRSTLVLDEKQQEARR